MEEIDFVSIFKQELGDEVRRVTDLILDLEKAPGEEGILRSLMREFHTIKGAARAIQFDDIKNIAHSIEDIYHALLDGTVAQRESLVDLTLHAIDLMQGILDAHLQGQSYTAHQGFSSLVESYLDGKDPEIPVLNQNVATAPPFGPPADSRVSSSEQMERSSDTRQVEQRETASAPAQPVIGTNEEPASVPCAPDSDNKKVSLDGRAFADSLLNLSGEITVAVGSLEEQRRVLQRLSKELAYLTRELDSVGESGGTEQGTSFKLLERLRTLQQSQHLAAENLDVTETRLRILSEQLDTQVTQARLVPVETVFSSFPRLVRDLSKELGKSCDLLMSGQDARIDHGVLNRVRTPLVHLIRNALDHGIEPPRLRKEQGKPEQGHIRIDALQLGSVVRISVSDDGSGIDMERLREKVLARGDTTLQLWEEMDVSEQEQFLFLPGFSTSPDVTETSGRGVGLDIVKTEVEKVGGQIKLENRPGEGTSFILELPLTLSLTPCVLLTGGKAPFFGEQHYAFPLRDIVEVCRVRSEDLRTVEGRPAVRLRDETLFLFDFAKVMGLRPLKQDVQDKHLLVLHTGTRRVGLLVDDVYDEQHIVSRRISSRLGKIRNVEAVTILHDGSLALIVDPKDLHQQIHDLLSHGLSDLSESAQMDELVTSVKHVLVVEDSQTVREVVRHFLENAGYSVTTAVNGVDGLNKLKVGRFDILISDIDMPRMNGIDMVRQIRADTRYKDLPIIIVSYKDREEDRRKAMEAGINLYVTKSEFDSAEMLVRIRDLLPESPLAAANTGS